MINYHKNDLINECLLKYYETFACTLDTADYVPDKFNNKILLYIYKNMKKQFKQIDKEDRLFQRRILKESKQQKRSNNKVKDKTNGVLPN